MDIDKPLIAVYLRDVVLTLKSFQPTSVFTARRRSSPQSRKGEFSFSREALSYLASEFVHKNCDDILVVGDGIGDTKFWRNLQQNASTKGCSYEVVGHFVDHEGLAVAHDYPGNISLHSDWCSLLEAMRRENATTRTFVDIDRTVMLPRFLADSVFSECRVNAISAYLNHFHRRKLTLGEVARLEKIIREVSLKLVDYKNPSNFQCYENEEAVALATLLVATGCIDPSWLSGREDRASLSQLMLDSIKLVERGAWIPGLGEANCDGSVHWHQDLLQGHLAEALSAIRSRAAVICPRYRECESGAFQRLQIDENSVLNTGLLEALRVRNHSALIFVSDRPAASLGIDFRGTSGEYVLGERAIIVKEFLEKVFR